MNLTVIIPSRQSLSQAGVRIRYDRIASHLRTCGWELRLQPINELASFDKLPPGPILFSKCHDAQSLILGRIAKEAGYPVGVDLFDDYFSQLSDVRFQHLRNWLSNMAELADFYVCSTPRMAEIASHYMPGTPGLIVNDPVEGIDHDRLRDELQWKRDDALRNRRLKILWFGIGDNPSFPVGLEDLAAQADQLRAFEQRGFTVQLTVLTNERSLNKRGLALLSRLGLSINLKTWSVEAEQIALSENLLSYLPVNSQPFSVAKSLNRAVTALAGGTQLLSVGYPLYAPLSDFIYRGSCDLLDDLSRDALKLRGDTLGALAETLDKLASPEREAAGLAEFLGKIGSNRPDARSSGVPTRPSKVRGAVLHGFQPNPTVHQFAQGMGLLSLATPLTPAKIAYDAHLGLFGRDRLPAFRLTKKAMALLPASIRQLARSAPASLGGGPPIMIPLNAIDLETELNWLSEISRRSMADRIVIQDMAMDQSRRLYERLFGELDFIDSEQEPLLVTRGAKTGSAAA